MPSPTISLIPHGATLQTLSIPTSTGSQNIVLSLPTHLYPTHNAPYFGESIGRYANRISNGSFTLSGKIHTLAKNDGENTLHGGNKGWGKKTWSGPTPIGLRSIPSLPGNKIEGGESVQFKLHSPDGDEGFPGAIDASVIYTSGTQLSPTSSGKQVEITLLAIEYEATLVEGEETCINMTNHSYVPSYYCIVSERMRIANDYRYFNLSSKDTIESTEITLSTNLYLPLSEDGIPTTTTPSPHPNVTPDVAFTLSPTTPSYDDCFTTTTDPACPLDTRAQPLKLLVSAYHPDSKIHLEVWSTEPGFQFYTGGGVDVDVENVKLGARAGFCVEPHRWVNAVNVDGWKAQVLVGKGEVWGSRVLYRAWADEA